MRRQFKEIKGIMDGTGNLYGTTIYGGSQNGGVVYKLSPSGAGWTETVLYSLCSQSGCSDGESSYAPLLMDGAGNLYGTTGYGGNTNAVCYGSSCGVAFQLATGNYALSVSLLGTGGGSVTSSPAGINCGATCSVNFGAGTPVTLTTSPASGSTFTGWGGACSGTGTCMLTMNSSQGVTATFSPPTRALSVSGGPGGRVTSSPSGIDCGSTCSASFAAGTQVTLSASPAAAWGLAGWGGACGGIGGCSITMNANTSVSASFTTLFTAAQAPVVTSPADIPVLPPPILSPLPQTPTTY